MIVEEQAVRVGKTIREHWQRQLEQSDEINLDTVAKTITAELLQNPEFLVAFGREYLGDEVVEVGRRVLQTVKSRRQVGATYASPEAIRESVRAEIKEAAAAKAPSRFERWMEFVPTENRLVALSRMTRPQLLAVARTHEERGRLALVRSQWLIAIAEPLKPGQTVGEVWEDADLIRLVNKMNDQIAIEGIPATLPMNSIIN